MLIVLAEKSGEMLQKLVRTKQINVENVSKEFLAFCLPFHWIENSFSSFELKPSKKNETNFFDHREKCFERRS